jgi:hypothetical protein
MLRITRKSKDDADEELIKRLMEPSPLLTPGTSTGWMFEPPKYPQLRRQLKQAETNQKAFVEKASDGLITALSPQERASARKALYLLRNAASNSNLGSLGKLFDDIEAYVSLESGASRHDQLS